MKVLSRRFALLAVLVLLLVATAVPAGGAGPLDWPAYLHDSAHSSAQPGDTAITPANVASLAQAWNWKPPAPSKPGQPGNTLFASPAVYDGTVYIGSNTGVFFALDEATGHVEWKRFVGFVPAFTCPKHGITSSAAVAVDPGLGEPVVYVGGGNGQLYALKASDGSVVWKSRVVKPGTKQGKSLGYIWGSPTLADGHVYIGMSANCDTPLIRAGVREFDAATGARLATHYTVPVGALGGSVWSSQAWDAATDSIWVTTGNPKSGGVKAGDSNSVVRLAADGLARQDLWTVPPEERGTDSDFGGSPTLFEATLSGTPTPMVGACNKNGVYYGWKQSSLSSGPVWRRHLGSASAGGAICIAAAIWDSAGGRLFVAGTDTTIAGTAYPGSVQQLDPATGVPVWARGLAGGPVLGSPALNGSGVLAAATYNTNMTNANRLYLINAGTGGILRQIATGSSAFAQPVFADGLLFVATQNGGLTEYSPGP